MLAVLESVRGAQVPLPCGLAGLAGCRAAPGRCRSGRTQRTTRAPPPVAGQSAPTLSDEQDHAVAAISASLGRYQPFLLDGVTGSGKTEVYLALIEQVLARGQQALLLVPEIGLAPQTVARLRARLGVRVEVLHSNLAEGDRARAWLRARAGTVSVILGTRSAVFTPLPHAGLVIVDEEHDSSYKQQDGFRYHARDLALVRARALGVPVVLGSGTPSLESLANVEAGRYRSLHLRARPGALRPPQVRIVDMRAQHLQHGMSPALLAAVADTLARGEQALVFEIAAATRPCCCATTAAGPRNVRDCEHALTLHAQRATALPPLRTSAGDSARMSRLRRSPLTARAKAPNVWRKPCEQRFPDVPIVRVDRETTRGRRAAMRCSIICRR